ncbi:hypothetical protein VP1G_01763 [Cytospora mali]|uniref:Flavin reductase like domain-containing protein n=1 Tax=Cytospora mali TaxID=578113 RepID=A0A194URZ9_CYTMA|nr:hypothetical protein VP1G_01763 [Valsa mali var. pyri (nom. inval.)]
MSESEIKRNPHPDFKTVEASRPAWDRTAELTFTQTAAPDWKYGSGVNGLADPSDVETKKHIAIDPHGEGRLPAQNYKLLISSVVPRPIAFISTIGKDGKTINLAPYSYFQVIAHDPPLFVVSFATNLDEASSAKHTLHNLHETGECTINIISEHFIEAANSTSINAPYGVSEWTISGLTPAYDTETVKAPRVKEAIFSIEGKLESVREFESKSKPGRKNATLAVIEGTRFWVREDAINEERSLIDANVLRPACRLGGITYARLVDGYELARPDFDKDLGIEAYKKLEAEKEGKI